MIFLSTWLSILIFSLGLLSAPSSFASFSNYNSVLIGDRAAGMGGAFTALSGDPSACSFYNPATLSLMRGSSLSASISLFNKYDTLYDNTSGFGEAPLRANQGAFKQIPAARGIFSGFGPYALGISILNPNYENYSGEVKSNDDSSSIVNIRNEALWVGGSFALNLSHQDSVGLTIYYTSVDYFRSTTNETHTPTTGSISTEEKTYTHNSLVYVLGYYKKLTDNWHFGLSIRPSSLPISGKGTYFQTRVSTGAIYPTTNQSQVSADVRYPTKIALGIAYERPSDFTLSFDMHYYTSEIYNDMDSRDAADHIHYSMTTNFSLGGEYFIRKWWRLRAGLFTNYSAHPSIEYDPTERTGDHLDMWGFSANTAIFTSDNVSFTFGGYYTGGHGYTTQLFKDQVTRVPKGQQIFSLLIGSSYFF